MKNLLLFGATCFLLVGCAALTAPTGSGRMVTNPDGTQREEVQADVLVDAGSGILGITTGNPFAIALAAQVSSVLIAGAVGAAKKS